MTQAHPPSRSSFPAVVAIIALFLLFWFLISMVYVDQVGSPEKTFNYTVPEKTLAEHQGTAESILSTSKLTDPASGKVRLSIERAKELVVAENAE